MQKLCVLYHTASLWRGTGNGGQHDSCTRTNLIVKRELAEPGATRATFPSTAKVSGLDLKISHSMKALEVKAVVSGDDVQELSDEDDDVCPAECVREFKTDEEFLAVLEKAKKADSLVVVDFYRTSCGSCKYIEQIFTKLCKGAGEEDAKVVFLKHNVIDEYDEQSEVAERLRIKAVPLFHFYRNGALLEAFPTRDKERILAAISKYSARTLDDRS